MVTWWLSVQHCTVHIQEETWTHSVDYLCWEFVEPVINDMLSPVIVSFCCCCSCCFWPYVKLTTNKNVQNKCDHKKHCYWFSSVFFLPPPPTAGPLTPPPPSFGVELFNFYLRTQTEKEKGKSYLCKWVCDISLALLLSRTYKYLLRCQFLLLLKKIND